MFPFIFLKRTENVLLIYVECKINEKTSNKRRTRINLYYFERWYVTQKKNIDYDHSTSPCAHTIPINTKIDF